MGALNIHKMGIMIHYLDGYCAGAEFSHVFIF
jgi:hypothetical protein